MKESELKGTAQLSHDMPMVVTTDNGEVKYCGKAIGVNQLYVTVMDDLVISYFSLHFVVDLCFFLVSK